jgi:hypothetical protein
VKRWAIGALVALVALTAFAHTSYGLRAIAWVTGSDGCPFGGGDAALTASASEQLRVSKLARGNARAPARAALGFALDADRRADVHAWAARHGITCTADRSGAGLRCVDVPGEALPAPLPIRGVVAFGFDAGDRLVSVQHQSASRTAIADVADVARTAMTGLAATGDELGAPRFVHRRASIAYADYRADVLASNLGKRWSVIQTYQSIPD